MMGGLTIAVCGGIGSGKSVVCKILRTMGYSVYDCDVRAKEIMDSDVSIIEAIKDKVDSESVCDGCIDRKRLAQVVFSDQSKLMHLNGIVHGAVRDDIRIWRKRIGDKVAFVETAIMYQSGLDVVVDMAWEVYAPIETRIDRVIMRNGLDRKDVLRRIEAQDDDELRLKSNLPVEIIDNGGDRSVLLRIEELICDIVGYNSIE